MDSFPSSVGAIRSRRDWNNESARPASPIATTSSPFLNSSISTKGGFQAKVDKRDFVGFESLPAVLRRDHSRMHLRIHGLRIRSSNYVESDSQSAGTTPRQLELIRWQGEDESSAARRQRLHRLLRRRF